MIYLLELGREWMVMGVAGIIIITSDQMDHSSFPR